METGALSIREATEADRQRLANLLHFEMYVHRHLDWRTPLEWIGCTPFLLAEHDHDLVAVLACSPEPPEVAWIRLFAAAAGVPLKSAWQPLWDSARNQLASQPGVRVAAIALLNWFSDLLSSSGFDHTHNVVVLSWERGGYLPAPKDIEVHIRPMTHADVDAVIRIDQSAFAVEWRISRSSLELAFMQSSVATVAEDEPNQIVGYQISTANPIGGHLARLAVSEASQGQGIGYALVHDLLDRFEQRNIDHITVNTQQDNLASLALYAKAGFQETGEYYRVYQYYFDR